MFLLSNEIQQYKYKLTSPTTSFIECVSDFFCLTPIFSAISWRDQVNFQWDDDEVRIVIDQRAELDLLVLAHRNNSPWIDTSPHSDILSWFWANQSLIFPLNAACLAEKQQLPIL
jgi:hypothetical protein